MNKIICSDTLLNSIIIYSNVFIDVIIIGIAQQQKPMKVFASVRNSDRTLQLAIAKHFFLSKCQSVISHEHKNLFHLNFIYKLQT